MITALRKEHPHQRKKQAASKQTEPAGRVDDKAVDLELRNLRIAIASLPTKYREPLVLQSIGYSIEDIAKLLGLTAVKVAARLAHGREQLQLLQNLDDETPNNILDDSCSVAHKHPVFFKEWMRISALVRWLAVR